MYLVFPTKLLAETAEKVISLNMGLPRREPNGYVAERWAIPVQADTGLWAFPAPPALYLNGVVATTVVSVNFAVQQ